MMMAMAELRTDISNLSNFDLGQVARAFAALAARTQNKRVEGVLNDLARQAAEMARTTTATSRP